MAEDPLALARAAAEGDATAQKRVVLRLLPRVRTTVQYIVGQANDAEDLVQESFIEILRSLGSYSGVGSLEGWADRIAARTSMRGLKKRRWYHRRVQEVDELWPGLGEGAPMPVDELQRAALRKRLAVALQKLSDKHRVAVVLRLVHEYRVAEIAEMLGTPIDTVRDRLRVGRARLRKIVRKDPVLKEWVEAGWS